MFEVDSIYGYLGTLKHEPYGDLVEYQKRVKDSEIAFRSALTQCVLEKDGKGTILFQRDFQDLAKGKIAERLIGFLSKSRRRMKPSST